jgi:hypothetical protein
VRDPSLSPFSLALSKTALKSLQASVRKPASVAKGPKFQAQNTEGGNKNLRGRKKQSEAGFLPDLLKRDEKWTKFAIMFFHIHNKISCLINCSQTCCIVNR